MVGGQVHSGVVTMGSHLVAAALWPIQVFSVLELLSVHNYVYWYSTHQL